MAKKIYVSSTYEDLKKYRKAVRDAIRKFNHEDVAMEYYVAESKRPLNKCLDDVRRCDIYVGIFAWRYGYIPQGSELSITEQEFRQALKHKKSILCFLLNETVQWPDEFKDKGLAGEKLQALRNEIKKHFLCAKFSSPEGLGIEVAAAIQKEIIPPPTPPDPERENRLMRDWQNSPNGNERLRARQALFHMGSYRYAAAIKDRILSLQQLEDLNERMFYLEELLQLCGNSSEAMPILVDLLNDEDAATRRMAIFNIGELGLRGKEIKPSVVREIIQLANDTYSRIRGEAAHTLGKIIHDTSVVAEVTACLKKLSRDPNDEVRELAEKSLELI